jgi:hypothetical protein
LSTDVRKHGTSLGGGHDEGQPEIKGLHPDQEITTVGSR